LDKVLYLIVLSAMFVFSFNAEAQLKHTKEWMHEAIQASISGDLEKAKTIFQAILTTNSNNIYALNNLGKIYLDFKEFQNAINLTKKAWELNPKFYMAGNTLGDAYKQNREFEKAESTLKQVIKVNPKFELAYLNLGEVYFLQKKYDDAEKLLKQALILMPEIKRPKLFLEKITEAKNK
jgi:tetratricopeptide (TPR) repeat protein